MEAGVRVDDEDVRLMQSLAPEQRRALRERARPPR